MTEVVQAQLAGNGKESALVGTRDEDVHLKDVVYERVLTEWKDTETDEICTLGSVSIVNKQDTMFTFKVGLNPNNGEAFIRFSLGFTVKSVRRSSRKQELLLVIPLHTLSTSAPEPSFGVESLQVSEIRTLAIASAIREAGLSDSDFVIRVNFNLSEAGYVLMPEASVKVVKPSTSTSCDLLCGLRSLSKTRHFTAYMRPSGYARHGLKVLSQRLSAGTLVQCALDLSKIYDRKDATRINWSLFELNDNGVHDRLKDSPREACALPPPPYQQVASTPPTIHRTPTPSEVKLPAAPLPPGSPSISFVPETPLENASPQDPCCIVGDRGIFGDYGVAIDGPSRNSLPPCSSQQLPQPDNTTQRRLALGVSSNSVSPGDATTSSNNPSNFISTPIPVPTQQPPPMALAEPHCNTRSRKRKHIDNTSLSDHPPQGSALRNTTDICHDRPDESDKTKMLGFREWITRVLPINHQVYNHKRLLPYLLSIGEHARCARDIEDFNARRARCSALFFYDPYDDVPDEEYAAARDFISDMEALIRWANRLDWLADTLMLPEFLELGSKARAAVLAADGTGICSHGYVRQKGICVHLALCSYAGATEGLVE